VFAASSESFSSACDVLTTAKEWLMLVPGVASVDVNYGAEGTLSTITIQSEPKLSTIGGVVAASKNVLLDAAANSETVYVMGYEAEPFKNLTSSSYATMLVAMPCARSACWDTYQFGCCPRGKSCKWQHPGKRDLQPVRVMVS
jgi:hypothetical protein